MLGTVIKNGSATRNVFIIVSFGLIFAAPAIWYGFPDGHDAMVHVARFKHFANQLWSGELYPRWLVDMNGGLGNPIFFFYGPIPYYVASLFALVPKEPYGWSQLGLAAAIAVIASGITAYIWLKEASSSTAALIAAVLYMMMPYPLAVDLYRRAALGEHWTFVWMPLVLYFTRRLASRDSLAVVGLSSAYGLLVLTHAPMTLSFSLIALGYAVVVAEPHQRIMAIVRTVVSMGLGIGLSAIYIVPAMITRGYVAATELQAGYIDHFLFSKSYYYLFLPYFTDLVTFLSQVTVITLSVAFVAFTFTRNSTVGQVRKEATFWLLILVLSLCMMLPISEAIWSHFKILQTVQHPWRLLSLVTVATAALLSLAIVSMEKSSVTFPGVRVGVVALLIIVWILPTASMVRRRYWAQEPRSSVKDVIESNKDNTGLRPRWVARDMFVPVIKRLSQSPDKARIVSGTGTVEVERWKAREIVLNYRGSNDAWLEINQFYYPGWTAEIEGGALKPTVRPSEGEGLLHVLVQGGAHKVILRLKAGFAERLGQIVSAVTSMSMLLFVVGLMANIRSYWGSRLRSG